MNKKVLLVVAHEGYQPIEYEIPKKILENGGYTVLTASNKKGSALAKDGSTTTVDLLVKDAQAKDYDAVIFIGGPGTLENLDNQDSYTLIEDALEKEKLLGAICISTRILAKAGVLTNIHATGWNGDNQLGKIYAQYEVFYLNNSVVYDEGIITAVGPQFATEFGDEIVRVLRARSK